MKKIVKMAAFAVAIVGLTVACKSGNNNNEATVDSTPTVEEEVLDTVDSIENVVEDVVVEPVKKAVKEAEKKAETVVKKSTEVKEINTESTTLPQNAGAKKVSNGVAAAENDAAKSNTLPSNSTAGQKIRR